MALAIAVQPAQMLEERLLRGADLLFEMESRGETGDQYRRWLLAWLDLLDQYESEQAA